MASNAELALMVLEHGASTLIDDSDLRQALRLCQVCRDARLRLEPQLRLARGWAAYDLNPAQSVSGNVRQIFTQREPNFAIGPGGHGHWTWTDRAVSAAVGPRLPTSGRSSWTVQHANEASGN